MASTAGSATSKEAPENGEKPKVEEKVPASKSDSAAPSDGKLFNPEELADPRSRFIEFRGVNLHYKRADPRPTSKTTAFRNRSISFALARGGEEKKKEPPPCVLLHGFGSSVVTWKRFLDPLVLALGAPALAFDRPAFGLSERVKGLDMKTIMTDPSKNPYTLLFSSSATVSFARMLRMETNRKPVIIGHSAGCAVALHTALTAPLEISGLVLVAPAVLAPMRKRKGEGKGRKDLQSTVSEFTTSSKGLEEANKARKSGSSAGPELEEEFTEIKGAENTGSWLPSGAPRPLLLLAVSVRVLQGLIVMAITSVLALFGALVTPSTKAKQVDTDAKKVEDKAVEKPAGDKLPVTDKLPVKSESASKVADLKQELAGKSRPGTSRPVGLALRVANSMRIPFTTFNVEDAPRGKHEGKLASENASSHAFRRGQSAPNVPLTGKEEKNSSWSLSNISLQIRAAFLRSWIARILLKFMVDTYSTSTVKFAWNDAKKCNDKVIDEYTKPLKTREWDTALLEFLIALGLNPPVRESLGAVRCPVLVVSGDNDTLVPSWNSRRVAEKIPGAKFHLIRNCGHNCQEETPLELLDAVVPFIRSLDAEDD